MTPRASFVIPAYNAERWISKAILSCRAQTVKQIEIIVVNDGSTDDTGAIIDWHAKEDKRIQTFHMKQNVGRSLARNLGNKAAQSDVILVLDADDMACRNRVRDTLEGFAIRKADLLFGSFFIIDGIGNVERKMIANAFDPEISKKEKFNFICHSTVAYTKKLAEAVRYDAGQYSTLGLDDWKFQWDAFKQGFSLKHVKTPLSYYRITADGVSATRKPEDVTRLKDAHLASL
jgi:glycosyltransferase involved in cell wall biosynthesis